MSSPLRRAVLAAAATLLLVPATAGAAALKGVGVVSDGLPEGAAGPMVLGIIASAVSGFAAIAWLLAYVRRHNYDIFVIYRLIAAGAILVLIAAGVREATF